MESEKAWRMYYGFIVNSETLLEFGMSYYKESHFSGIIESPKYKIKCLLEGGCCRALCLFVVLVKNIIGIMIMHMFRACCDALMQI